ncbi:MAG: CZB domain-containing protein [Aquificaceae bacterium]
MVEKAERSAQSIGKFKDIIKEFEESALQTQAAALTTSDRLFMTSKKLDHIIFKNKTYSAIVSDKYENIALARHTECNLGKWYYSDKSVKYKDRQAFKDMEQYHEQFHNLSIDLIEKLKKGEITSKDKDKVLQTLRAIEENSMKIFEKLDEIVEEGVKA